MGGKPRIGQTIYDGGILELKEEGRFYPPSLFLDLVADTTNEYNGNTNVYKLSAKNCIPIGLDEYLRISAEAEFAKTNNLDDIRKHAAVIVTGTLQECIELLEKMPTSWTGSTMNDNIEGLSIISLQTAISITPTNKNSRRTKYH
jgi:hypothetical protein